MSATPASRPSCLLLILICVIATAERAACGQVDGELRFDQKFRGLISSSIDADLVQFSEVEGSRLTITVTRDGKNGLKPMVELLNAAMEPIPVGDALNLTRTRASIRGFETLYGGTYHVRVTGRRASTGTYRVRVKGVPADRVTSTGSIGIPAEIDEVRFQGRLDGKVKGTIVRQSGDLVPIAIELVGPSGILVSMAGKSALNASLDTLELDWIRLPELGTYRLRLMGQGGTTGDYRVRLRTRVPGPVKGTVWEDEHPRNPGSDGPSFTLSKVLFGRGLKSADGLAMSVVSPFSTVRIDPLSSLPLDGTLEALFAAGDLSQLVDFNLGAIYSPPVVPRNGVLVLRFSARPELASLNLDENQRLTGASPFTVAVNGRAVPLEVFVKGKDVILNPVFDDHVGFPPSPVALDGVGNPTANVFGTGKIELLSSGPNILMSTKGGAFRPRGDLLGSSDAGGTFIGFNPGNQILDFFAQSGTGSGSKSFGGFLPDLQAPRLVRELAEDGDYQPDFANPPAGDQQGLTFLSLILPRAFDTISRQGRGEWSGGLLILRPDGPAREQHRVARNTVVDLGGGLYRNEFHTETAIRAPLATGQEWRLMRAELFEPDPNNPIDPDLFDPFNPELDENTELIHFVELLDRHGDPQDVHSAIDPLSRISFLFDEAMQVETFRPYESFYVSDDPKTDNPGLNRVGMVTATRGGRRLTFHPDRIIQFGPDAGTREAVGLGNRAASLLFHLQVVPPADVLLALFGETGLGEFLREGYRGVTDVGGQPLGLPPFSVTAENPLVDYSFPFSIWEDAELADWTAIAQRFQGLPRTGFDAEGNTGITYRDVPTSITTPGVAGSNLYGPRIADLNLFANGFLSGAPVQFFTKIHDDFNPPPSGQFTPSAFGTSTPIGGWAVLGGARMQHVFRAVDASPDWVNLAGTNLDLIHMAYAPIGAPTNTTLPDISIHAGHTPVIPDTSQRQGVPDHGLSGLRQTFANNYDAVEWISGRTHTRQLVAGSVTGPGTHAGVQFNINNSLTFTPIGSGNTFHPLPDQPFDHPFAYNNGVRDVLRFNDVPTNFGGGFGRLEPTWPEGAARSDHRPQSLLIEYRTRVVDVLAPPATQNGFTFSLGVLSTALPRFRSFTFGAGCMSCCAPIAGSISCGVSCIISYGPSYNAPQAGSGGQPLEPDLITEAVGPAPSPPGMECKCIAAANNATTPPAICTQDNTVYNPSMDQVAYGAAGMPSSINFGDNARYFMLFNYVKRESFIRSPFIQVQPGSVASAIYHAPIFVPPLDELPDGTVFDIRFRSSPTGTDATTTVWVTPEQMADVDNPINLETTRGPFLQFEVFTEGNTSSFIVPIFDEIIVPLERGS